MVADPDLVASLGKLQKGQIILVDTIPMKPDPIIQSVELYTPPQTGLVQAIKPGEINGNKTTQADIDVDGTAVVAWSADTSTASTGFRTKSSSHAPLPQGEQGRLPRHRRERGECPPRDRAGSEGDRHADKSKSMSDSAKPSRIK